MVVDPWGDILARLDKGESVAAAELSATRLAEVRGSLPALQHRKL
jgi:nitrilase